MICAQLMQNIRPNFCDSSYPLHAAGPRFNLQQFPVYTAHTNRFDTCLEECKNECLVDLPGQYHLGDFESGFICLALAIHKFRDKIENNVVTDEQPRRFIADWLTAFQDWIVQLNK